MNAFASYIRGAPRVVNGARDEDPPLPIDDDSLTVIGHTTLCNRKKKQQQRGQCKKEMR